MVLMFISSPDISLSSCNQWIMLIMGPDYRGGSVPDQATTRYKVATAIQSGWRVGMAVG